MDTDAFLADLRATQGANAAELLDANPELVTALAPDGTSLLQQAIYMRADTAVEALLKKGANIDLFAAAALGDLSAIRSQLARGANPQAVSPDGFTALHLAAHFGRLEAATLLRENKSDVNAKSANGLVNCPLHAAASGSHTALVKALLSWGARVDTRDGQGFTPLHIAAAAGVQKMVDALLAHGANVDARANDGRTPRDIAHERGHEEIATRLAHS